MVQSVAALRSTAPARALLVGAILCLLPVAAITVATQGSFHECTGQQSTANTPSPFDPPVGLAIILAFLAPLLTYVGVLLLSTPTVRRRALYVLGVLGLLLLPLYLGLAAGGVVLAVRASRQRNKRATVAFVVTAIACVLVGGVIAMTPLGIVISTPAIAWTAGVPLLGIPIAVLVMAGNLARQRAHGWALSVLAAVCSIACLPFGFVLLAEALRVFTSCILD